MASSLPLDSQEQQFLVGPAISTWQNSGGLNTNWIRFIKNEAWNKIVRVADGKYFAQGGTGSNFYENFRTHIGLARDLGSNCFRLSLEWHHIEPKQGVYSPDAVKRYHEIFQCLLDNGMTPVITLYHFVEPDWFTELGGFEKEENIPLFVDWAVAMIAEFARYSRMWVTFNEPTVKSTFGYVVGNHPPGHMFDFKLGGRVILHQLLAHIEVYKRAKLTPDRHIITGTTPSVSTVPPAATTGPTTRRGKKGAAAAATAGTTKKASHRNTAEHDHHDAYAGARSPSDLKIGLVHNYFEYAALGDGLHYTLAKGLASTITAAWANEPMIQWFCTGRFKYEAPFGLSWLDGSKIDVETWNGPAPVDFVGLNYYSRFLFHWTCIPWKRPGQTLSDMFYPVDPEGLYHAIRRMSECGLPIYITETGVADKKDRGMREAMIKGYSEQVVKAVQDGFDVRGFMYWTLIDNFEWDQGFRMCFGLYNWARNDPVVRIKEGAKCIVEEFKRMKMAWLEGRRALPSLSHLTAEEVEEIVRPGQQATEEAVLGAQV